LLTAVLARQAAATVGVRTCWPWETAATLPSARRRKALRRQLGRRGAGHTVAAARGLQLVYTVFKITARQWPKIANYSCLRVFNIPLMGASLGIIMILLLTANRTTLCRSQPIMSTCITGFPSC